jgi:hypothetical protein
VTIPRYRALHRHWRQHPRPEWLIAGYIGYKPLPDTISPASKRIVRPAPPTGALQSLFHSLGGKPGQTVVMTR